MSTYLENAKKDLHSVKQQWDAQPNNVKQLDKMAVLQLVLFGISYLTISISDSIKTTPTNSALIAFPLFMAGWTFVYRMRLARNPEEYSSAKKEFITFFGIMLVLVLITIIYGLVLLSVT